MKTQNTLLVFSPDRLGKKEQTEPNVSPLFQRVALYINYSGFSFKTKALQARTMFTFKQGHAEGFRVNRLNLFLN